MRKSQEIRTHKCDSREVILTIFFFLFFFFFFVDSVLFVRYFSVSATSAGLRLARAGFSSQQKPINAGRLQYLVPFLFNFFFFLLADTKKVQEDPTNFNQNSKSDQFIVHWHCHCVFVWCLSLLLSNMCQCAVKWRCHWGCGWQRLFLHHRLKRQNFQRCNRAFFESCWDWNSQSFCEELSRSCRFL